MFRIPTASRTVIRHGTVASRAAAAAPKRVFFSSKPSKLEPDYITHFTHVSHKFTKVLAILAPVYFAVPSSYTDGVVDKVFGVSLSAAICGHSWYGINAVASDYVPKISKSLLGPARYATAAIGIFTLFGLIKVSLGSPGGIKGLLKGVWNGKQPKDKFDY